MAISSDRDTLSDEEIVRNVASGDVNAFEILLTRHKNHIGAIVGRHIPANHVEETAHDVLVRAYRSLPSFRHESSFKHWLSRIAVRTCYDFWRKRYRSKDIPVSSLSEDHAIFLDRLMSAESITVSLEKSEKSEAKALLHWALNHLTPEDRMVIELVHLEEYSCKEAAEFLGWSVANVKIRSFRARKKLRTLLTKQWEGP